MGYDGCTNRPDQKQNTAAHYDGRVIKTLWRQGTLWRLGNKDIMTAGYIMTAG